MISLIFNEDNISCENDKYRDLYLLNDTYKISVGDVFSVGNKKYSTVETHKHNGMFCMLNITDGILEKDMPFDSIYEMLNTNFRNCKISFLTHSRINNKYNKSVLDYIDSWIECECDICGDYKVVFGTINKKIQKMIICDECVNDLMSKLNKIKNATPNWRCL